ncbi:keratin-associated protein 4-9-like [Dendronephthya gigantea]|uniref:keratin-associated protein 4-9-like n=1 Tax=Dendronephthya gigantea TaxID=151771 RepID=UPI00106CB9D3|nr:keratin-associated protein 4-9-like [Dendronephthya gigantea]
MHSFLFLLTVLICLPASTTAVLVACSGSNSTCQEACLKHGCTKWDCNGSLLNFCEQSCFQKQCSHLTCDKTTHRCNQECGGCKTMNCYSSECNQKCLTGYCNHITCDAAINCQQLCVFCRNQRCYNIKECIQTCVESDCSLKCLKSDVCLQNCHGNGCSANCHSNESCLQTCHDKANCTKLICESESCQQNCKNSSYCGLLSCHGKNCRQETFVEKSELVCTSSRCEEQISHASNTILYCNSVDGSCIQKCYGSGCVMTCGQDVKKCQQYCGGGNCNMTCASGVGTCSIECPGGNCTQYTSSTASVLLKCTIITMLTFFVERIWRLKLKTYMTIMTAKKMADSLLNNLHHMVLWSTFTCSYLYFFPN